MRKRELVLGVSKIRTHGNNYYRILIPKRISNLLGLQQDDKVRIQINEIIRNGSPLVIPDLELNLDGEDRQTY